tara:strand:- start:57 stop:197 length:141 start_codon:yes stop_codon:yes gene_type:complete
VLVPEEVIGPGDRHDFGVVLVLLPLSELRKVNKRIGIADDNAHGDH